MAAAQSDELAMPPVTVTRPLSGVIAGDDLAEVTPAVGQSRHVTSHLGAACIFISPSLADLPFVHSVSPSRVPGSTWLP